MQRWLFMQRFYNCNCISLFRNVKIMLKRSCICSNNNWTEKHWRFFINSPKNKGFILIFEVKSAPVLLKTQAAKKDFFETVLNNENYGIYVFVSLRPVALKSGIYKYLCGSFIEPWSFRRKEGPLLMMRDRRSLKI